MDSDSHSDSEIKRFYQFKNIAVVGMSKNEEKPSHQVPKYLIEHGYNVIPVNPTLTTEVLGRKPYPSIADVPEKIDVVDVFRKSEEVPAVIDDAINRKKNDIQVIWMQLGYTMKERKRERKKMGLTLSITDA